MKTYFRRIARLVSGLCVVYIATAAVRDNAGFRQTSLARNDDDSSSEQQIGFTLNFFGRTRSSLFVNNNGNVTFGGGLSEFTPFGLTGTQVEIIAAFFADVDTTNTGSRLVTFGQDTVSGRRAFGVNYIDVGYFDAHADKLNSFQLILIDRSDTGAGNFDIEFNYDRILWETGDASDGVNGFGGVSAAVGYSNGSGLPGTYSELPGSRVPGSFLDSGPASLVRNSLNSGGVPGRYVFNVRFGAVTPTITSLSPTSARAGGGAFQLTVNGTGYVTPSVVRWDSQSLPTTFVNETQLTATVAATLIASARTVSITVATGSVTSNAVSFPVVTAESIPLTVAPVSMSFTSRPEDSGPPAPQILSVFTGTFVNSFTIAAPTTTGGAWLSTSLASGATPGVLLVRVNPAGLAPGNYSGQLTIRGTATQPGQVTVPVTFSVERASPAELDLAPREISFPLVRGAAAQQRQAAVYNLGSGTISFTASASGGSWLVLNALSGSATFAQPGTLTFTVDPAGLVPGTYVGEIVVRDRGSNQTKTMRVVLAVSARSQSILLTQPGLDFTAVMQGVAPPAQSFAVLNNGTGQMDWTLDIGTLSGGSWLRASPLRGTSVGGSPTIALVNASVDPQGLEPGTYFGFIRVLAAGAGNSPQTVSVRLTVLPAGQGIGPALSSTGVILVGQQGGTNPAPAETQMFSNSRGAVSYVSTFATEDGASWLTTAPPSGQLSALGPVRVSIAGNLSALTPGIRRGIVRYGFSDGTVRTVNVVSVVAPAGGGGGSAEPAAIPNCRPSSLAPAIASLEPGFAVSVGDRVPLRVIVQDNCGNPRTSGTVVARITGERSPLSLSHETDGIWAATWVPNTANTRTTVSVTALASQATQFFAGQVDLVGSVGTGSGGGAGRPLGVYNAASFQGAGLIAPGSWGALFGEILAEATQTAPGAPYPTEILGTKVTLGGAALPLYSVNPQQVNFLVPLGLTPNSVHQLLLQRRSTLSVALDVTVAEVLPGLFATNRQGTGQGSITIAGTGIVAGPPGDGARPAARSDALEIYCTGLGAVTNPPADNTPAPVDPLASTIVQPTVTIGGQNATVLYSGLTPGLIALYQINVLIPSGAPSGNAVPVVVTIGGVVSNTVTIAIQ